MNEQKRTIGVAVTEFFKGGAACPYCLRWGKIYQRSINRGMVGIMFHIYWETKDKKPENGWLKISDHLGNIKKEHGCMEYSKLKFWGLLEPQLHSNQGFWRITEKGIDFLLEKITIPRSIFLFGNELVGLSTDAVSVIDILGKNINYDELMKVRLKSNDK